MVKQLSFRARMFEFEAKYAITVTWQFSKIGSYKLMVVQRMDMEQVDWVDST